LTDPGDDPVINQLRTQISDIDLQLVELLNRRLTVVDELWQYKAVHGVDTYDPEREARMIVFLDDANAGPLSPEALKKVYRVIVETVKDEAHRLGAQA
jgi:3-deoxy-7-phosphoheptulonate synthase / chorismate mutase